MSFIVAVDGPAGSGKGTITKEIEKRTGLINLDTGATYRCFALEVLKHGYAPSDTEKILKLLDNIDIKIENEGNEDVVLLNGKDVTDEIRTTEVTEASALISTIKEVRAKMVELQRKMVGNKNVIVEGRDIGTVVFPHADLKIYLDADDEVRAQRRYKEYIEKGMKITYDEVLEQIRWRDENDKHKEVGALKRADDAIVVDTSNKSIEEVVESVKTMIEEKMKEKEKNNMENTER